MPVFDFTSTPDENHPLECTYTLTTSNENTASPKWPVLLLDNRSRKQSHRSNGMFTNPVKRASSEFQEEGGTFSADILQIDAHFVNLLQWLGENHIQVRLPGQNRKDGYAAYEIREFAPGEGTKLPVEGGFLQFIMSHLFTSSAPESKQEGEEPDELGDHIELTSLQSIFDLMIRASRITPDNIRFWAGRNLVMACSHEVFPKEKRHAQWAPPVMINIQRKSNYFKSIDPVEARQTLDEELYGMEQVKQRVIETIIRINRTRTLPAYGLLLAGHTGTRRPQIAYTVARILRLPWTTLDVSSINGPKQPTGSSRIHANAKLGIIMKALPMAGESNLALTISELNKAAARKGNGNLADVLLTLLDNFGFTDNYIECVVLATGIHPMATANDKPKISASLVSRFAVIDIPDHTPEEKKIIFSSYVLPKILTRMSMCGQECTTTEDGLKALINQYHNTSGVRDLERAAERIAINVLHQVEVDHVDHVVFDTGIVRKLLG